MKPPTTQDSTEVTHLEKLRSQLSSDMEAMQAKEASLKEYEQRLRLLVDHAHQTTPPPAVTDHYRYTKGPDQNSLDSAWEKHNRAHALLEAARRGLSDDRMLLKEREQKVALREQEVSRREAWVAVREQELATATPPAKPAATRKTKAPFAAARKFLSRNKS